MASVFALVDCNNFFVSCERTADPSLEGQPIVVLSNNDGCIISRSNEAKALGFRMGEPYFKVRRELEHHRVRVFSGNFSLYSRKSDQVMQTIAQFTPLLEAYSIDEAFMNLPQVPAACLREFAEDMRATILRKTGIPVSIGLAQTKTLAKLASHIAKKSRRCNGILNLYQSPYLDLALSRTPVEKVWGVGRRLTTSLQAAKVFTARDLRDADDRWILRRYNVVLLKTVLELRGKSCLPLQSESAPRQSVMYSRSFGTLVETRQSMESAVSTFTARAAEKLREDGMSAGYLSVYMRTSRFIPEHLRYSAHGEIRLPSKTDCTSDLIREALAITRRIFCEGYAYYKAAILLADLSPTAARQMNLFETRNRDRLELLMQTLDQINHTFGAGTLQYASEGFQKSWLSKKEKLSTTGLQAALPKSSSGYALIETEKSDPQSNNSYRRPVIGFVHPVHG